MMTDNPVFKGFYERSNKDSYKGRRDRIRLDGMYDDDEQLPLVLEGMKAIAEGFVSVGKPVTGFFWQWENTEDGDAE